ncbi:ABC transporter substrate-binding protein [Nesterenkonia alba]|uniref:ABC transporter substrate-binding protein n=1 Tax=Nesterenkonia alba TaxID=515814 RepID=UPI0003B79D3E|nr:extracellular solute-binding protein [Nesterenkonia alba]
MTDNTPVRRRALKLTAAACAGILALSACGNGGDDDGEITLTVAWWGSDTRHQNTYDIIEAYEEENPGIRIEPQYGDWDGYWDQLATQFAGGDGPDVIQMDDNYLREYGERGQLLELTEVDVSELDEDAVENGRTENEGLIGVTTGINAMVLLANPDIFEQAGVEIPDDTTWTWDDYREIAATITEEVEDVYGATGPGQPPDLQMWLRQQGQHLTTEEGELGFDAADAEEYFEHLLQFMEEGAYPPAAVIAEDQTPGPDESMTGSNEVAMGMWWTNQVPAISEAAGVDMVPLRMPSQTGNAEENGMWFKSTMLWSANAGTDHPEEVQDFIEWMVNSEDVALMNGTDRGLPSHPAGREAVLEELDGPDLTSAEFLLEIEDEVAAQDAEPVPAMGFSAMQEILRRYELEVFFERQSPAEAAEAMIAEMESEVGAP